MSKLIENPISAIADSVSKGVETVAGVFTTNKEKDAQRTADEQMALLQSYQAEFNARQNRTWIDSIADGFNRLIRPLIVSLILFIFVIAYISPAHMAEITLAMSSIPDGYWTLLSVIIAFYFGGRMQLKSQQFSFNKTQAHAIKALIETKAEFRKLELDNDEPDKVFGDTLAKQSNFDETRANQVNQVVEAALIHIKDSNAVDEEESKQALREKIAEMNQESHEDVVSRRRFGPRRLGRR
ncbi:3TM-type holin [Alteromonas gilva]|uniref:3TM-type holin n=1 Tax=Alteromonas gilva TaxID=2987522 RepID=A0ABT5L1U7_9ALTE|nr:3TM-type holin [Alteromonas gilva]MDC8829837.1 3TM-type holin [Alteromonas gilva]